MRLPGILLIAVMASSTASAKDSLYLAGTVPLKAEVSVQATKEGPPKIISKSSPELKVKVHKRAPASVVEVLAP
ncbi:hypothetical protein [Bdellovibrio bacteriovorus]|uniref:hypothetical protein n=1 Tax=Bdellovibrio TaxID=958 RepID=UPI0035A93EB4